jgi:hypothetical protein
MKWGVLVVVAILSIALFLVGCTTQSTTTDGDRGVLDQGRQAADVAIAKVQEALTLAAFVQGSPAQGALLFALVALRDTKLNFEQQIKVHGPPKKSLTYTPENAEAERNRSTESHAGNTWFWPVAGVVVTIASFLLGMPWLSRLFPALTGVVGKVADTGIEIFTAARKKAEENGGSIDVKDLLAIAKEKNVLAGVQAIVAPKAKALEKKLGVEFTQNLKDPDPPAPAPEPAPAAAPTA